MPSYLSRFSYVASLDRPRPAEGTDGMGGFELIRLADLAREEDQMEEAAELLDLAFSLFDQHEF